MVSISRTAPALDIEQVNITFTMDDGTSAGEVDLFLVTIRQNAREVDIGNAQLEG